MIATVNCNNSILLPWYQTSWKNTPPQQSRRGARRHRPFDYFSSIIYPFYMFYTAKLLVRLVHVVEFTTILSNELRSNLKS